MQYYRLRFLPKADRPRAIRCLEALCAQLDAEVPDKDAENNLLLATWNIRDLGKANRRGYGPRLRETHFYLAQVLSRFDFVAVQEVNELPEWERVMDILGPDWDYIATDVTNPKLGGNGERLTFVFDRRKVRFRKVAGEIVLPADALISAALDPGPGGSPLFEKKQFRRTPFRAAFQAGWFKFDICTVHLYYGAESGPQLDERVQEIRAVAEYLKEEADRMIAKDHSAAVILLGDFNIVHPEHKTMKALTDAGFKVPQSLRLPANIGRDKYYDQIAFLAEPELLKYVERTSDDPKQRNAGVFEVFDHLFTDQMFAEYRDAAAATANGKKKDTEAKLRRYYKDWRTYQISDHKPMWVRLSTNDSLKYLKRLSEEDRPIIEEQVGG
jgi:endonuclease/exonuclease/phosphatase family metal-dependent hydrolase